VTAKLQRDPDRLFPADPATRDIARGLYETVAELAIISPHGHVDTGLLLNDTPFADPADLFIRYDHYVTRILLAMSTQSGPGVTARSGPTW
jgi:glucuronate isomerase